MTRLVILARGAGQAFFNLAGRSVLGGLPFPITIFTDRANAGCYADLEGDVRVEVVRWSDRVGIAAQIREMHALGLVSGIATVDEMMMDLAGELRSELGLPGLDAAMTARFRDKRLMKQVLGAAGIRVPHYVGCEDRAAVEALQAQVGRLVIKPFDGLGSRGVVFVDDAASLAGWFEATAAPGKFQAEEWIDGTLYHVNAIVVDGRVRLTASAPYLPGMANIDFGSGAPFVSVLLQHSPLRSRLERFSDAVIATLGLRNGVTHLECFVTDADEIVFCEIGARPGGGGIVWMMEAQTGVHYGQAVVLIEAGRADLIPFRADADLQGDVAGMMGFRWPQNGFVRAIPSAESFEEPWVLRYQPEYEAGDFVPACAHCTDYIGLLIFRSRDHADFAERRAALHQRFYRELEMEPV